MWYYEYWVTKYGLTRRQDSLLEKYREIRKRYPWGQMEPILMYADTLEDAWRMAGAEMTPDEVDLLKQVFGAFKDDFDREWQGHDYLHRRKKAYEEIIKQYDLDSAFEEVQRFYGVGRFDERIDVHLLYNPSRNYGGGSAHAGIQIEATQGTIRSIDGLLHEAFHLFEPRKQIEETLMKCGIEHEEAEIVREAAMDSLLPDGVITEKYLAGDEKTSLREKIGEIQHRHRRLRTAKDEVEKRHILFNLMRAKLAVALLPLTRTYLEREKTVWDNYWSEALEPYYEVKESVEKSVKHLFRTPDPAYIV